MLNTLCGPVIIPLASFLFDQTELSSTCTFAAMPSSSPSWMFTGAQATAGKPTNGSNTALQIRDTFQQPSAAFAQSLIHGVEHGQLSGEGFLAVQQQPGVYVASSSGDANIQQMLRELHPQIVAIAVLRHADTEQPAGPSLLLQDGSKLHVGALILCLRSCFPQMRMQRRHYYIPQHTKLRPSAFMVLACFAPVREARSFPQAHFHSTETAFGT